MSGRRPSFRIQYKAKDGTRYDVGVIWESERFPGMFDVKPQKTNEGGQWPKKPLSEAAAAVERGEGFLSLLTPKPSAAQQSDGSYDRATPKTGSFDDDTDLPF